MLFATYKPLLQTDEQDGHIVDGSRASTSNTIDYEERKEQIRQKSYGDTTNANPQTKEDTSKDEIHRLETLPKTSDEVIDHLTKLHAHDHHNK